MSQIKCLKNVILFNMFKIFFGKVLFLLLLLNLCYTEGYSQQKINVQVYPGKSRGIKGHLVLERSKYFNLGASARQVENNIGRERFNHYFKELEMTLGRRLGMVYSEVNWGNSIYEDPERPGYADMDRLIANLDPTDSGISEEFKNLLGENQDLACHDRHDSYPSFMEKYSYEGAQDKFPVNNDAASELAVTLLEHDFTDWTRPAYFEPVNEPNWRFWDDQRFIKFHASIYDKVKSSDIDVKVGGPCFSVGYYYKSHYGNLKQITDFIDRTDCELDFYSYHIYDFMKWSDEEFDFTGSVNTGLPTEGVFDAIAGYTMNNYGREFNYVASEHGGYITDSSNREYALEKLSEKYFPGNSFENTMEKRSIADFLAVSSQLANTFTFMNHPHIVLKAVPFTLLESFDWNPHYYASLLVADNFNENGNWVESKRVLFYEFFEGVEGRRVLSFCDDADVQHHAFVHDNRLILIFNNQSSLAGSIDLNIENSNGKIDNITVRKLGRESDFRPYFNQEKLSSLDEIEIKGREAIALFVDYEESIEENILLDEVPYYSDKTGVQFTHSSYFNIEVPDYEKAKYAVIRVGIGLDSAASKEVSISINGTDLNIPVEDCADRLDDRGYGSIRMARIDSSLLQNSNIIKVKLPEDQKGGVGAVVLRVGYNSADIDTGSELQPFHTGKRDEKLVLYPNPVNKSMRLKTSENGKLYICNTKGVRIWTDKLTAGNHTLNMVNFPSGMYFLRYLTDNDVYTRQFVVNH